MNQVDGEVTGNAMSIPHARGDEPRPELVDYLTEEYSPRTWG